MRARRRADAPAITRPRTPRILGLAARDAGGAAAEIAAALPAVAGVLAFCLAALGAGTTQVSLADAAADAARILARGDDAALAEARVAAVHGGRMHAGEGDLAELVCVDAAAPIALAGVPLGVDVTARACALGGGR